MECLNGEGIDLQKYKPLHKTFKTKSINYFRFLFNYKDVMG